jgi:SAM-dependent methyltransferase
MRQRLKKLVPAEAARWAEEYSGSVAQQVLLQELVRAIGKTDGQTAVDVGMPNPVISLILRRLGGTWHTVAMTDGAEEAARTAVKDSVHRMADGRFTFANKSVDLMVVAGVLEYVADDAAFIEECHRVLKPTGRLIVETSHRKSASVVPPIERFLGVDFESIGLPRDGYNESDVFQLLKHGFDVVQVRSYIRFFTRITQLLATAVYRRAVSRGRTESELRRTRLLGRLVAWLAFQLDYLIWFTRGYRLIVSAKRRAWIPRRTPVLSDGRSISEAVLTKAPR